MTRTIRTAGIVATTVALVGAGAAMAPGLGCADGAAQALSENQSIASMTASSSLSADYVEQASVQGVFTFDQSTLTGNDAISKVFRKAAGALCGAKDALADDVQDWSISVGGDVKQAFSATLEDLADEGSSERKIITCACSNNLPAGGAIATAEVEGVPVAELLERAGADRNVNTVTFVAADGLSSSLPLDYALEHGAVVAFDVNGESLERSVGGTNQLWIESASGRYFTRDIVQVCFTAEDEVPAAPEFTPTDDEYVNRPNVSVKLSA